MMQLNQQRDDPCFLQDEGWPFGLAVQAGGPNDPTLLQLNGFSGERFGKRRKYYRHVCSRKLNESEPFDEASKSLVVSKGGCIAGP